MPKNPILGIVLATVWIGVSEFVRNELLFKDYWTEHYDSLGLTFETTPVNGILWLIWSLGLAYFIYKLLQKFSFAKTFWLSWLVAFLMMWITAYNLQVLPLGLLIFAIPLSLLEVGVAG